MEQAVILPWKRSIVLHQHKKVEKERKRDEGRNEEKKSWKEQENLVTLAHPCSLN
jgi:hypothetical protein